LPRGFLPQGLQCTSADDCVASGVTIGVNYGTMPKSEGDFIYTTNDGASWSSSTIAEGVGPIGPSSSLSCTPGGTCLTGAFDPAATSQVINSSSDGGATWSQTPAAGLPEGAILGLSCPGAGVCWATGVTSTAAMTSSVSLNDTGFAAMTTDGGATWQDVQLPSSVAAVLDVSCPTTSTCFAVGVPQVNDDNTATQPFVFLAYATTSSGTS
jgi:hypothetical protein